jgi:pyruvate/2-oxoacid:ferredoxin oxidoreductase alpha subunit
VVLLGDGYLGQMTGKVQLPDTMTKPGIPQWAVYGDAMHRRNLISSIFLTESDLEAHNVHLNAKYEAMKAEARAESFMCEDAEVVLIACNTPARTAKGAVQDLRHLGIKAGLFRPITLWPFPVEELKAALRHAERLVVVEASAGQLEDEVRLALSRAGVRQFPDLEHVRRMGGILPQQNEITDLVLGLKEVGA